MDQELRTYLDERFGQIDKRFERIDERFERVDERFERMDEKMDRGFREAQISVEGLRGEVQILAEGVIGLGERLQSQNSALTLRLEQVQVSIAPLYADLNRRLRVLEERAEREGQAPLDYIRERYGKPKTSA
jgi:chaperonin cofactor prefoldin